MKLFLHCIAVYLCFVGASSAAWAYGENFAGQTCSGAVASSGNPDLCMACAAYTEGSGYEGMMAVAKLVNTRVSEGWASGICGVVFQRVKGYPQFSGPYGGRRLPSGAGINLVMKVVQDAKSAGASRYNSFHSAGNSMPGCERGPNIGGNVFYKCPVGGVMLTARAGRQEGYERSSAESGSSSWGESQPQPVAAHSRRVSRTANNNPASEAIFGVNYTAGASW